VYLTFAIEFEEDAIKNIQKDYIQVKCDPNQLKLIKSVSQILSEQIDVPILTMRGVTWYALKEWQTINNKNIAQLNNFPITEKLFAAKEIFDIGKRVLTEILKDPCNENKNKLDIAYEKAFKIYLNAINRISH